jgi:diamine N-acetyltransferase
MIRLRPIRPEDIADIKNWPPYSGGFMQMDYALRDNGWIDEFREKANARLYAATLNNRLIGFSLLSVTTERDAEFRIAIHPDRTGKGLGREVALATLETGFRHLNLDRIHLIVRKNNPRAARLYTSIGFDVIGKSVHAVQGKDIEFVDMDMSREQFDSRRIEERA